MRKLLVLLAALLMMGCVGKKADVADHVIIIGLDGWGGYSMRENAKMPHVREFMKEGSYTLYNRTVRPSSSGPNWAAQLNGTPSEASGIISNAPDASFKPLVVTEHNFQPTIFHVMRQERPDAEMGVICEWKEVLNYVDTLCLSYKKPIDKAYENIEDIVKESVKYLKEKNPVICFIHINSPDQFGHAFGRGTPEYYATLEHVDGQIAQIVDAVKEAGYYDDSVFILSSDHGHNGKVHGGDSNDEIEVPLVIWGKGIKKDHEIQEPVIMYDVAATIAKVFNLKTPASWRGVPINVFE